MGTLFGLAAALTYGCGDFIGGLASRRAGALRVVVLSHAVGLVLILIALPLWRGDGFAAPVLGWGAAAGGAGGVGVVLLYRGLARGRMSVVAPITAVIAAAVPVVYGIARGERPGVLALVGVVVAFAAVILVSSSAAEHEDDRTPEVAAAPGFPALPNVRAAVPQPLRSPGIADAIGSGLAFGAFFVFFAQAGTASGLWPLVGVRLGSLGLVALSAAVLRRGLRPPPGTWPLIVAAGTLDLVANLLYLLATGRGLLSLVAVLTSLYPASTVVLARVVLAERFTPAQTVGLGLAALGAVLIALG